MALPDPPTPRVPLEAIAQLLPWGLLYHSLLPFCEAFNPDIVAPRTGPPPWTLSLEYFYQLIHPDVWTLLEFDEDCDRIACEELRRRRGAIERGEEGDAGGLRDMLYEREEILMARRMNRHIALLALHVARQRYFAYHQKLAPDSDERKILALTSPGNLARLPVRAAHTIWPLAVPHHDEKAAKKLLQFGDEAIDWSWYRPNDQDSFDARAAADKIAHPIPPPSSLYDTGCAVLGSRHRSTR